MKKVAIITGANTGIGYEVAKKLLKEEFEVIIACRSETKALIAIKNLNNSLNLNDSKIKYMHLNLLNRNSIKEFSENIQKEYSCIDILINNAGVMVPNYTITENNLEIQLDVNYVGHFYLTYLLLNLLKKSPKGRIINMSSLAAKSNSFEPKIQFNDINFVKNYNEGPTMLGKKGFVAYSQSKFALTLFTLALAKKLKDKTNINVYCVHPGVCNTDLSRNLCLPKFLLNFFSPLVGVATPEDGANIVLYAILNKNIKSGEFIGPTGKKEWKGKPGIVKYHPNSLNEGNQNKLWKWTEEQLNIKF